MESFTLREATKGDSKTIAELVYKTEDDPEHVWGYGSKDEIINRRRKGLWSYYIIKR